MKEDISIEKLERVAFILKTIAHPLRIGVIKLLHANDKLSVTEICTALQSEQSLTSHHLNIMKLKGIVQSTRIGKNIFYSLKMKEVVDVLRCMQSCEVL